MTIPILAKISSKVFFRQLLFFFTMLITVVSASAQFRYDFTTTPDSASVLLNGEETCTTPCRVKFFWRQNVNGKLIVSVEAPGYETWADTLTDKPRKFDFDEKVILKHAGPENDPDSTSAIVGFDKLLAHFDDGTIIGTFTNDKGDEKTLRWEGKYKVGDTAFEEKFYSVLTKTGFNTPFNEKIELFKDAEDRYRLPRYVVGIQITDLSVDLKYDFGLDRDTREIKGRTEMEFKWQVLDKKTGKVVLDYDNRGVARYRQSRFNTNSDNLMAFEDGLYDFLRNSSFFDLVNNTALQRDYAAGSDSSTYPLRIIPEPKVPDFENLSSMIKFAGPACVTIITDGGFGSGVVISSEGYLLSAYHVVEGVNKIQVKFGTGLTLDAEVIAYDFPNDVVLLDIVGSGFTALPVHTGEDIPLGQEVITIGTPASLELGQSIAKGMISGKRLIDGQEYLQADMAVSPGNSGGPLLNEHGEVVGIVQSKIVQEGVEGIGFALPIDRAIDLLNLKIE